MRLFTKFIQEHRPDLETAFLQQDKDHSGKLSSEDLKTSLKLAGLRLTNVRLIIIECQVSSVYDRTYNKASSSGHLY